MLQGTLQVRILSRRISFGVFRRILIWGVTGLLLFPFYWLVNTSLQEKSTIYAYPPTFIPSLRVVSNYLNVLLTTGLARWLLNSLMLSALVAFISITIAVIGAYSISRFRYRGKALYMALLLGSQMLPGVVLIIPLYLIFKQLGLLDNLWGLVIADCSFTIPIGTFFLKGFFDSIPYDLEEAASIDGCTRMGALRWIVLPLAVPGIVATGSLMFVLAWNEYLFARTIISSGDKWVTAVGMASFIGHYTTPWSRIMAAAVLSTVPVMFIFVFFQKYLVRGLTAGAVKG